MNTKRILGTLLLFLIAMMLVMCGQPPQPEPTTEPTTTPSITPLPQTLTLARSVFGCQLFDPPVEQSDGGILFPCHIETIEPTVTAVVSQTPPATVTDVPTVTPTATPQNIPIFADAPLCPDELHDDRAWHSLWNSTAGCHYDHQHGNDPHELDHKFGTMFYAWAGGELSSPWQTFTGAGMHHETPGNEACMENTCKHAGYIWLTVQDFDCRQNVPGILDGAQNCITNGRVLLHVDKTQIDALTRIHSVWVEAEVCNVGIDGPENCGVYRGGGHLDLGRLNIPRGVYAPLPNDPDIFMFVDFPPEAKSYRIHSLCDGTRPDLDSWQSEGNWLYELADVPMLSVGYAVHFNDPWGCVNPAMTGNPQDPANVAITDFFCYGQVGCKFNGSEFSLFRIWVIIPDMFDNGEYDIDGREGYFSYTGYTDRYGTIQPACTEVGLDCVPVTAEAVPVGRGRLRANQLVLNQDFDVYVCGQDRHICQAADPGSLSVDWITYPNYQSNRN